MGPTRAGSSSRCEARTSALLACVRSRVAERLDAAASIVPPPTDPLGADAARAGGAAVAAIVAAIAAVALGTLDALGGPLFVVRCAGHGAEL